MDSELLFVIIVLSAIILFYFISKTNNNNNNTPSSPTSSCPLINNAPACPSTLTTCNNQTGYCYDSTTNSMYSTYYVPQYDYCPTDPNSNQTGTVANSQGLWFRQGGKDTNCPASS